MNTASRLVLATRNPGKVDEIRALLSGLPLKLIPSDALDEPLDVEEDAPTLRGNAEKKARAYHNATGLPALADDTGLEVDALDGAPGVHTARFAGPDATPDDNMHRLLDALNGVGDRSARFRTVVCLVDTDGTAYSFDGTCEGTITREPRGEGGFGYDPIFLPNGHEQTFAEMNADRKNAISHRKNALEHASEYLHARLNAGTSSD